ncbi:unnamed protein product [Bursaphelenchus xylophilus]|uniref:(pine wood nematode) hypothetical protein n=1 Tax=Bursaphelenchus xylophilus TaxID=6326 RepID=A0A1I7RRZ5_BURXY|nr:unnamed protein product [Bursaphelenchus xylophilus]CAG9123364.1 unnamed protein product [Bursaphelenchus xylophilus]
MALLEEELRSILNSLSYLSAQGDLPVQTFATLVKNARTDVLVEHLHQRWLSDSNFGNAAARIVAYIHRDNPNDMKLPSKVLSLSLDDYKKRYEMRRSDRKMFRNYCRSLVELMPIFFDIDKYMGTSLVRPLFDCMFILTESNPDDGDLLCVAQILIRSGQLLYELDPHVCDKIIMKCRLSLCSNDIRLSDLTRFSLLNAADLWTYRWNLQAMPYCLLQFYQAQYEAYHLNEYEDKRWLPQGMYQSSTTTLAPSSVSSFSKLTNDDFESIV